MSEVVETATTAVKFIVAFVGGHGVKSTSVSFLKDQNGVRLWAWIDNSTAMSIRAGSVVSADAHRLSSVKETSYLKEGVVTDLKVPRRQVFLGGNVVVDAPEQDPLPPVVAKVTDEAKVYASRVDSKVIVVEGSDEPF